MYYTVYKITNNLDGKIYIGVHKTKDLNDDYMGSGVVLKRAIKKHGIENFTKEYIEVFDNADDMFNMESVLVNEEFVSDKNTYNLKTGGFGGFDHINSNALNNRDNKNKDTTNANKVWNEMFHNDPEFREFVGQRVSEGLKLYYSKGVSGHFTDKVHTEETKKLMSKNRKDKGKGSSNSQFGSMWIHNLEEKLSKKIKKEEFLKFETEGWLKGRKMKF